MPLEPTWTAANPRVDAVRGCVALERGPLVYCFESHDQPADVELADVQVDTRANITIATIALPHGEEALEVAGRMPAAPPGSDLYLPLALAMDGGGARKVTLNAIPYYTWGNRGMRSMRVWLPKAQ